MELKDRYNQYEMADDGKSVIGHFSNGLKFFVDLTDLRKVQAFDWYLCGYPEKIIITNRHRLTLHRYLLDCPDCEIDHIDLDRFNNRRSNLRCCSHRQNQCNHGLQSNNTSGVAGARFYKPRNRYAARIKHFGQEIHLGYYDDLLSAMQARNVAMELLFGEFARLNEVPPASALLRKCVFEKCAPYLSGDGIEVEYV